jgi:coenzyme F420-reducing hydrogenase delta subunit
MTAVKTLLFACRWCALLGAERAGRDRLALDPDFRLIPVECACSISLDTVLRAFADGAHGVAVMGCHLGGCRHNEANRTAQARLEMLACALNAVGIRKERLLLSWGTAHESGQFAAVLSDFQQSVRALTQEADLKLAHGEFPLPLWTGAKKEAQS